MHIPVLTKEVIEIIQPQKGKIYLDATLGCGGHTKKIFEKCPECIIIGIDWDKNAIEYAKQRLIDFILNKNLIIIHQNFINIKKILSELKIDRIDGAILDFGMSTLQLKSNRGFSFNDLSLDMRMDTETTTITAKDVVNNYSLKQLTEIFLNYGEEKYAKVIAEKIVEYRKKHPITSAKQLAYIITNVKKIKSEKTQHGKIKIHPATKVFQALRIFVNNELNNIEIGLNNVIDVVSSKGRVIAISYHSLEDRIVKHLFKMRQDVRILTKKPLQPQNEEIKINISSRSAKLRAVEKL
ncbi:MAG: 16S rRNA (cytosine(1402)-N(4))-methyltransferase RsmH [Endomicrobia bacterium]|nr:16S rRNA (cytosine(1402)-N(4))-methyltransferase RsmH [Endomicrobiia bacterium]